MSSSSSPSPKSTDAEHGSAKDSPDNDPSTTQSSQEEATETTSPNTTSPTSRKRHASVDLDPDLDTDQHQHQEQGHDLDQDHPANRYAGTRDAHEEFRAVGRPTKMTRRESELAHIAAAQREIEKAEKELGEDGDEVRREGRPEVEGVGRVEMGESDDEEDEEGGERGGKS